MIHGDPQPITLPCIEHMAYGEHECYTESKTNPIARTSEHARGKIQSELLSLGPSHFHGIREV